MSWPLEIHVSRDRHFLDVIFEDSEKKQYSAEYLRVNSPSAEVQGHGNAPKKTVTGKENVKISDIQAIGKYAIRIIFDDGHNTGLYTWDWLYHGPPKS